MKCYIHPFRLRLSRLWIYNDGERGCCRVNATFGILHRTTGISNLMTPREARRELEAMENYLYREGFWPLWFWLFCCGAYVIMAIHLLSFIFNL